MQARENHVGTITISVVQLTKNWFLDTPNANIHISTMYYRKKTVISKEPIFTV
jgi:hypothetical protein